MRKAKDRTVITLAVVLTIVLVVLLSTTLFAAFTASNRATTTIRFADGVSLNVSGISNNKWTISPNTTTNVTTDATFSAISATEVSGVMTGSPAINVYVRLFAIVWTNSSTALNNLAVGSGGTTTASYTTKENSLITSASAQGSYKAIAITGTFDASGETLALLNAYKPFTITNAGDGVSGDFVKGVVVISATNTNPASTNDWDSVNSYTYTSFVPA